MIVEAWKAINDALTADEDLEALVGSNIRRARQREKLPLPGVTFWTWTGVPLIAGSKDFTEGTFRITAYAEDDLTVARITDQINEILHGKDLTYENEAEELWCISCEWDGYASEVYWSEEEDCYRQDNRFRVRWST